MKKNSKKQKICVVFVCTGNTCRSPVAERILKFRLKKQRKQTDFRVLSAGLAATDGDAMASLSTQVLCDAGIPCQGHKSRSITDKLVQSTDIFICMTESHKHSMRGLFHPHVYSIAEITGGNDVMDPYGGRLEDYKRMFDYLEYAMPEIEAFINKKFLTDRN